MATGKFPAESRLRGFMMALAVMAFTSISAHAQEGVWTDVFNGKDLTGLKQHGNGTVKVTGGVIDVDGGSGYLYHINLDKHACGDWPSGPELQMMQGDVGSIWTTDCKFDSRGGGGKFGETGAAVTGFGEYGCGRRHFIRALDKETVGAWNT